jgi:esterase/lipase superfamily enzyme
MATTVHFATNRVVTNAGTAVNDYQTAIVPVTRPDLITYGTVFVDGIDIRTSSTGAITNIGNISTGRFAQSVIDDLRGDHRNLLVFIHGFDNSFSDAITRAAFNREWLAASGVAGTDTSVVAFSWPSLGEAVAFPILPEDYLKDEHMARNSGMHGMAFLANLEPILTAARAGRRKVTLLTHSMGNLVLQSSIESWFLSGNGGVKMFDLAVLAAGDCDYDAFDQPNLARLSGLVDLSDRVAIYFSRADNVLQVSMFVNLGAKRLGQDGPHNRADTVEFPTAQYAMQDCSDVRDYPFDPLSSHQYYRESPTVRGLIADAMG